MTSAANGQEFRARELPGWVVVACALGLVELAARFALLSSAEPGRLPALVGWYGALCAGLGLGLGLALALLAAARRRAQPDSATRLASLVAAGLAAYAFGQLGGGSRLAGLASLALAWVVFGLVRALARRAPVLASLRTWVTLGVAALLVLLGREWLAGAPGRRPASAAAAEGPSVLLVTIDTLRADRVGAYGHAAARTPVLDELAHSGVTFENAVTASIWTGPSHASILSGLLPAHHLVLENLQVLRPDVPTLAEELGDRGYDTGAVVASAPVSEGGSRLPGRFESYDDDLREDGQAPPEILETVLGGVATRLASRRLRHLRALWRPAGRVTDAAIAWLELERDRPFFEWVHYFDPHLPYAAPERYLDDDARAWQGPALDDYGPLLAALKQRGDEQPEWLGHTGRLYDAEVAHVDDQLGRLIEVARRRAGGAGLWIVVTSDHGESFGEHGIFFSRDLYEPSLRVPLIVVPPEGSPRAIRAGARVAGVVRTIDIAPTLLELLGCAEALATDGASFAAALEDPTLPSAGPGVSSILPVRMTSDRRGVLAVRTDRWKSIWRLPGWDRTADRWVELQHELYDLDADPAELRDVSAEHADVPAALWPLADALGRPAVLEARRLGERELEALRELGYAR